MEDGRLKAKGTAGIKLCLFCLILSDKKDFCKMPASGSGLSKFL
jgi:hypothetical protein